MAQTMKIGFTGTQEGMTYAQKRQVKSFLNCMAYELHHGDCTGADQNVDAIAHRGGIPVVLHPPINDSKRAFCAGAREVFPEKPYLERNREIVDATDRLIATPKSKEEELRSGTWATIRYARKLGKTIYIIYPDGECSVEETFRR